MFLRPHHAPDSVEHILGTSLTFEEVQQDLCDQYGPGAFLGNNLVVKDIAHGKGFVARTGVIENVAERCTLGGHQIANRKLVIKIVALTVKDNLISDADGFDERRRAKLLKQMHNAECKVYHKLSAHSLFPGPSAYISKPLGIARRGYILMDYHDKALTLQPFAYLEKHLVFKILHVLAKFHACSQYFTKSEKDKLSERIVTDIFGPLVLNVSYNDDLLDATSKFMGNDHGKVVRSLKAAYNYLSQSGVTYDLDNMDKVMGMERLLCHGDPWLGNFLFSENNGKTYVDGLIDFQTAHFGCIGHDLSRLFCYVLSPEERRGNINTYIAFYCRSFYSHWPLSLPLPFSENQVHTACERFLPMTAYVVAVLSGARGEERCRSSGDPARARSFLRNKICSLVEDMERSIQAST